MSVCGVIRPRVLTHAVVTVIFVTKFELPLAVSVETGCVPALRVSVVVCVSQTGVQVFGACRQVVVVLASKAVPASAQVSRPIGLVLAFLFTTLRQQRTDNMQVNSRDNIRVNRGLQTTCNSTVETTCNSTVQTACRSTVETTYGSTGVYRQHAVQQYRQHAGQQCRDTIRGSTVQTTCGSTTQAT